MWISIEEEKKKKLVSWGGLRNEKIQSEFFRDIGIAWCCLFAKNNQFQFVIYFMQESLK